MTTTLSEMKKMINLANHLDSIGLYSEADVIDQALVKMAQTPQQNVRQTKKNIIETINPQVQDLRGKERRVTEVPVTGPDGVDYSKRQVRQDARAVTRSQNQDMRAADAAARAEIRGQRAGFMGQIRPQTQDLTGRQRRMQEVPVAGATESRSGIRGGARSAITSLTPQGYDRALQRQTGKLDSKKNQRGQAMYDLTPEEEANVASLESAPQPPRPNNPQQSFLSTTHSTSATPADRQRATGIIPLNSESIISGESGLGEKPVRSGYVDIDTSDSDTLLDEAYKQKIL
jgi:hypothetical protein